MWPRQQQCSEPSANSTLVSTLWRRGKASRAWMLPFSTGGVLGSSGTICSSATRCLHLSMSMPGQSAGVTRHFCWDQHVLLSACISCQTLGGAISYSVVLLRVQCDRLPGNSVASTAPWRPRGRAVESQREDCKTSCGQAGRPALEGRECGCLSSHDLGRWQIGTAGERGP